MRDINRIKPVLEALEKTWLQYPDMRFGQLIYNIFWVNDKSYADMFYPEDDVWLEWIKNGID